MSQYTDVSDEELVQKSLENIDYFGVLVDRYQQKLLYYIVRISSFSFTEAEEILQEVFLKTWQNLNSFDGSLKFSSWIYRITHNETISAFRKHSSRGEDKRLELNEDVFDMAAAKIDLPVDFDQKLNAQLIRDILDSMDEKYREVLVLHFLEEKSYDEISDILKKPIGTIGTLINRAKKMFREKAESHNITFPS